MNRLLNLLTLLLLSLASPAQDLLVWPGVVEDAETGVRTQTGQKNALAHALIVSEAGDEIQIHGDLGHINLCVTGSAVGRNDVFRAEPIDALIVGADSAVIHGIDAGARGGGYAYLGLRNLAIDARGRQVGILGYMNSVLGVLDIEDCELLSDSKTKWGFRIHGWSDWLRFVNVTGWGGGQEHLAYVDHTRGFNPENGLSVEVDGLRGAYWKRTLFQGVTRKHSGGPGSPARPAAPGSLLIANSYAKDCGAHGAFNYTVAGWPEGTVTFRDNRGESKHPTGLFAGYRDWKQEDLLNPDGFAIDHLIWAHNVGIYPHGDREVNEIGSVGRLEVRVGDINSAFNLSPNRGMDFAGAGVPCGVIELQSRVDPNTWNWQMPQPFLMDKTALAPDEVRELWFIPR